DYLIDQLSSKFGVKIDKKKYNTIDLSVAENTKTDSTLKNLINSDPNDLNYSRFSYVENAELATDGTLTVTYSVLGNKDNQKKITIAGANEDLKNNLLQNRLLIGDKDGNLKDSYTKNKMEKCVFNNSNIGLTEGEIAGNQKVQETIQGYMDELDKFAATLAYSVNSIQTGSKELNGTSGILDKDGKPIAAELLFVKSDDATTDSGITAKNISINSKILDNLSLLNCGKQHVDDYSGEKDGSRALAIAQLKDLKINIGALSLNDIKDRNTFFNNSEAGLDLKDSITLVNNSGTGSKLNDYYSSIITKLASNVSKLQSDLSTQKSKVSNLDSLRLSESGVSLDEEMSDLIQFQHSYQANAKMISTVDELLDVVINGLKR
ncbi:flagellar basal body rod C-terminal domain-containing protein, partial [uncultured Clostridium sp.]|uniref:flagellar basal body rod C-terminal domain-containing protein n=1 Tax=uncultured Clostridium sp. TaxID=59620 RepID=UPI0025F2BE67